MIAVVTVAWVNSGPAEAGKVGTAATVLLTLVAVAPKLFTWWRRAIRPAQPMASVDMERAKDILARQVSAQWKHEAVLRSLSDPEPIPVPWRLTQHDDLMDHHRLVAGGVVPFRVQGADIANLTCSFRALRRRRLVILGGPGTGKTTLAMQLLLELTRTRQPAEPVPVLVSAARWDTEAYPRLHDWLGKCLATDYPALRAEELGLDAPGALAAGGEILPVLDGLDELPEDARTKMLAALNRSMDESDQLILTSRSTEFRQTIEGVEDVLTAAAVIEPEPLTPDVAADYLGSCLPPKPQHTWTDVLNALRKETSPALVSITSIPLGLWLIHATYVLPRRDPSPLLCDPRLRDPPALRAHLFDQLIPALIESRPPSHDPAEPFRPRRAWNPDHVRRWLVYLARLTRETRDLAWWRLAGYTLRPRMVQLVVGIVTGLLAGLLYAFWSYEEVATDIKATARVVLSTGLPIGIVSGFFARGWLKDTPGRAHLRLRGRMPYSGHHVRSQMAFGYWFGLLAGVAFGLFQGALSEPPPGVSLPIQKIQLTIQFAFNNALLFALSGGLAFGLVAAAERPALTRAASSAISSWGADRALTFVKTIFSGLATALMFGAGFMLLYVPAPDRALVDELVSGLVQGLIIGLAGGLVTGRHHAWLVFTIAVLRLAMARRLPRRLMPFLEDAHRLGLLRAVGPVYQFRHADLHDHLASPPPPTG